MMQRGKATAISKGLITIKPYTDNIVRNYSGFNRIEEVEQYEEKYSTP
jgi:hypothetical protein